MWTSTWNVVYTAACIVGFSSQIIAIAMTYFEYGTVTRMRVNAPEMIIFPDLHVCFLYLQDAMNWNLVEAKYGKMFKHDTYIQSLQWMDILTIADIMEFTTSLYVDECTYRDRTGHDLLSDNHGRCNLFHIDKYVFQQYICYHMAAKEQVNIPFRFIHASLIGERWIYEFRFSRKLGECKKIRLTLTNGGYPYISRNYSPSFYKRADDRISMFAACQNYTHYHLGFPFDKFPCENKRPDFFHCLKNCLTNSSVATFGRYPYTEFLNSSEDIKFVSRGMLQNESIRDTISNIYFRCYDLCPMFPCTYSYCLTVGRSGLADEVRGRKEGSSIDIESPLNPDTSFRYIPSVPFLDLIVYSLSTIGIWFGISILSCNPVIVIKQVYDKHVERTLAKDREEITLRRIRRAQMRTIGFNRPVRLVS